MEHLNCADPSDQVRVLYKKRNKLGKKSAKNPELRKELFQVTHDVQVAEETLNVFLKTKLNDHIQIFSEDVRKDLVASTPILKHFTKSRRPNLQCVLATGESTFHVRTDLKQENEALLKIYLPIYPYYTQSSTNMWADTRPAAGDW